MAALYSLPYLFIFLVHLQFGLVLASVRWQLFGSRSVGTCRVPALTGPWSVGITATQALISNKHRGTGGCPRWSTSHCTALCCCTAYYFHLLWPAQRPHVEGLSWPWRGALMPLNLSASSPGGAAMALAVCRQAMSFRWPCVACRLFSVDKTAMLFEFFHTVSWISIETLASCGPMASLISLPIDRNTFLLKKADCTFRQCMKKCFWVFTKL